LTKAVARTVEVQPISTIDEAVNATRNLLVKTGKIIPVDYLEAKTRAVELLNIGLSRLNPVVQKLTADVTRADAQFRFSLDSNLGLAEAAKAVRSLDYEPNFETYKSALTMRLIAGEIQSRIAVAFFGIGPVFKGLLAAVGYFVHGTSEPILLSDDLFLISYADPPAEMHKRFEAWLEACIVKGLAEWRKTLL
jgi:hypothetical protein